MDAKTISHVVVDCLVVCTKFLYFLSHFFPKSYPISPVCPLNINSQSHSRQLMSSTRENRNTGLFCSYKGTGKDENIAIELKQRKQNGARRRQNTYSGNQNRLHPSVVLSIALQEAKTLKKG